ncbi:MAG: UDP-3-O-acyl-N-acetylglucosamine deacetylase [Rickettsiales bacterium]
MQKTLKSSIQCSGVALHSGAETTIRLIPAEVNTGIVFRRTDISADSESARLIPARYDNVVDTTLCTVVANSCGLKVATIEHLMSALWGMGIDNAIIEIDGAEVPIMDGSAEPFLFLIECAGVIEQHAPRKYIQVIKEVAFAEGEGFASIKPAGSFVLDVEIAFKDDVIGTQRGFYDFARTSFKQMISRARTFGFAKDVERMRAAGLARGGSLDNAVVVGDNGVLNEEGLRFSDEFVRHKALDCIGDYFLAGHRILGKVTTHRPGHGLNNKLMRALLADTSAWVLIEEESTAPMQDKPAAQPQPALAVA